MCSCTWTCPSYCCCCCCFFFFLFFDFLGKLCCSSFFIFSLLLSFVIFCFCFFFRRDCFSKYDFYFLINLGDCFFFCHFFVFFFCFNRASFFNKGICKYLQIYFFIPPLFQFQPNKRREIKFFSIPSLFHSTTIFYPPNFLLL